MPQKIKLADIDMSGRERPIDPLKRDFIASSVEFKGGGTVGEGLDSPFIIEPVGDKWRGVTGGHRHAALVAIGWSEVEVGKHVKIVEGLDDFLRKLTEIDENLCRNELNMLDRARFIVLRKKLCSERRLQHGGDRKSRSFQEQIKSPTCAFDFSDRFTKEVSEKVGLSESSIKRALRIGLELDDSVVDALRGTNVEDNQQQLLALCDEAEDDRLPLAQAVAAGQAHNVYTAKVAIGREKAAKRDVEAEIQAKLIALWHRAGKRARAGFMEWAGLRRDGK